MCHGRHGMGSPLITGVLHDRIVVDDADSIAETIANGIGDDKTSMPAFGRTLARDQIDDIVTYLKAPPPR